MLRKRVSLVSGDLIFVYQTQVVLEEFLLIEKSKWVKVQGWEGAETAREMILAAVARAK